MSNKEQLISLITKFADLLKLVETEDVDDELNLLSVKIENMTLKVFGKKIPMDFGMIHLINENAAEVIQYITDYDEVSEDWNPHPRNER